jgi:hypothetical protein
MSMFTTKWRFSLIALAILASSVVAGAQTYRGGIGGTVLDPSGAVIANAKVVLTSTTTDATRVTNTTSSGDYVFQDLQLGTYSLTITAPGFGEATLKNISVNPGAITPVSPKLTLSGTQEVVDVSIDTTSEIQTESSANNAVVGEQAVSEIPLNGRDFTQLLKLTPGLNSSGSLNGARSNQLNYQIDGADNNDIWQGSTAANQGGVGPIAGVTLPIEAIDQFSVQSAGNAEEGHSSGGLVSLALKTGTNKFHGTEYFYGRSEFFAARDFFALASARKQKVRNQQYGGSIGGPVMKDKLFFYLNFERQAYGIQLSSSADTEPGAAYVTEATALLARHGIGVVNPLSTTLLTALWPGGNAPPSANPGGLGPNVSNYVELHQRHGYSNNSVGNLNYILSPTQTVRLEAFIGTGHQAEPGGATYPYFQVAPDITQSFSMSHNWAVTDHFTNQLLIATGIFNQTFNDLNHSFNMPALGLNTGVTNPALFGAPTITLAGFDGVGATQPLGRKDYTGHITDSATWVHGAHEIRFGGEFRRSYIDLQYQSGVRGNFGFTGYGSDNIALPTGASAWSELSNKEQICGTTTPLPASCGGVSDIQYISGHPEVLALADFMQGYFSSASFTAGVLRRDLYRTDLDYFIQDQYKVLPKLVLNYGVRYDFFGDLSTTGPWSVWRPGNAAADANGLIQVGEPGTPGTYKPGKLHFSPRVGFAWNPVSKLAVHGNYGLYFDSAPFNGFGNNSVSFATGSNATGLQANPFGGVQNVSLTTGQWITNQPVFANAKGGSTYGLFSVDPNLHTAYANDFGLTGEYQINPKTVFTLAYVGSIGVHLYILEDVNQAAYWSPSAPGNINGPGATGTATQLCNYVTVTGTIPNIANANCLLQRRPSYLNKSVTNYQAVGAVVQVSSNAASNFNSLQAVIKSNGWHGLTSQLAWTYGKSMDNGSGFRSTGPTDSTNLRLDYSPATFDIRHTLDGYLVWDAPQIGHRFAPLTKGWQTTLFATIHTPSPFSITEGDFTGIGMNKDRVQYSGANYKTGSRTIQTNPTTGVKFIQYWVASPTGIFSNPAYGSHGNTGRDQFRGPGFYDVDAALAKNTQIHEGVSLQFRADLFNLFNIVNPGNPVTSLTSNTFGQQTSAPTGITAGAPFNVQFAGKIIF